MKKVIVTAIVTALTIGVGVAHAATSVVWAKHATAYMARHMTGAALISSRCSLQTRTKMVCHLEEAVAVAGSNLKVKAVLIPLTLRSAQVTACALGSCHTSKLKVPRSVHVIVSR